MIKVYLSNFKSLRWSLLPPFPCDAMPYDVKENISTKGHFQNRFQKAFKASTSCKRKERKQTR